MTVSIYDLNKEKYLKHLFIPSNLISNFIDIFKQHNLNPFLYGVILQNENKVYYTGISNSAEKYYVDDRLSRNDPRFQKIKSLPWKDIKIHEINVLGSKSEISPIAEELMNNDEIGIHFSEDFYTPGFFRLEITHPSATKKNALLYLKDLLKIDKLICFGDADNDISMFEIADEKYAVENAVTSLKKISTKIIQSNQDDGVARFLEEKFLNL
ncbi:MAG: HAD hydrolase family protein [Promethearchaeota archaeon]